MISVKHVLNGLRISFLAVPQKGVVNGGVSLNKGKRRTWCSYHISRPGLNFPQYLDIKN